MAKVFTNHKLTQEQEQCLNDRFGNWEVISLPNRGMSPAEAKEFMKVTRTKNCPAVFFFDTNAGLLLAALAYWSGFDYGNSFFGSQSQGDVFIFIFDEDENKWQLRDLTDLL